MKKKRKIYVYLITRNDNYQLPLGCFDTIKQCATFLNALPITCAQSLYRKTAVRGEYLIFKVKI